MPVIQTVYSISSHAEISSAAYFARVIAPVLGAQGVRAPFRWMFLAYIPQMMMLSAYRLYDHRSVCFFDVTLVASTIVLWSIFINISYSMDLTEWERHNRKKQKQLGCELGASGSSATTKATWSSLVM